MDVVELVLLIAAAVVFLITTFNVAARINLLALGLLLWVLVPVIHAADSLT